jgi:hypothetical protein
MIHCAAYTGNRTRPQSLRDIAFDQKRIDDKLNDNEIVPDADAYNNLFANTGIAQKALDVIEELVRIVRT